MAHDSSDWIEQLKHEVDPILDRAEQVSGSVDGLVEVHSARRDVAAVADGGTPAGERAAIIQLRDAVARALQVVQQRSA